MFYLTSHRSPQGNEDCSLRNPPLNATEIELREDRTLYDRTRSATTGHLPSQGSPSVQRQRRRQQAIVKQKTDNEIEGRSTLPHPAETKPPRRATPRLARLVCGRPSAHISTAAKGLAHLKRPLNDRLVPGAARRGAVQMQRNERDARKSGSVEHVGSGRGGRACPSLSPENDLVKTGWYT